MTTQTVSRGTALITVLLLCSCGGGGPVTSKVTIRDSAGIEIVENDLPLWGEDDEWLVSQETVLEIGAVGGSPEQQLFRVEDVARLSDGRIAVLDGGAQELRIFAPDGQYRMTVGGAGDGPGEFQRPQQLEVLAGDTLRVWDDRAGRTTWFDANGSYLHTESRARKSLQELLSPPYFTIWSHLLPDGAFFAQSAESRRIGEHGLERPRQLFLWISPDLAQVDTLGVFGGVEQAVGSPEGRRLSLIPPYPRTTWWAFGGNPPRVVLGEQEAPEIFVFEAGRLRRIIRWASEPEPITAADIEAWKVLSREWMGRMMSAQALEDFLESAPIPDYRAPYGYLHADVEGNVWIEEAGLTVLRLDWLSCRVFDPTGRLLGTTQVPPIRIMEIGPDYILGVHYDDDRVQSVRMYRLIKP